MVVGFDFWRITVRAMDIMCLSCGESIFSRRFLSHKARLESCKGQCEYARLLIHAFGGSYVFREQHAERDFNI